MTDDDTYNDSDNDSDDDSDDDSDNSDDSDNDFQNSIICGLYLVSGHSVRAMLTGLCLDGASPWKLFEQSFR